MAAVNGVATFSNLSINRVGTGYVLTATDGSLTSAASNSFNITASVPAKLTFAQQPSTTAAGAYITPAVTVLVQDIYGNTVTTNSNVTVALTTNPGGGTLSGSTTVAAVNGVATFSNLAINKTGSNYVLTATDGTLTSAASSGFNILTGPPTQLAFGVQPASAPAGASIGAVSVLLQDAYGNTVISDNTAVTLALTTNPGNGTLSGNSVATTINGLATFNGLALNKAGTGYVLTATSSTLPSQASNSFNITAGPAAQLAFGQQPTSAPAGASLTPAVTVLVQDAFGNTMTSNSSNVTLALTTNPGGGTLSGTTTMAAVNGVATFSNLSLNLAGSGYALTATDGSLTSVASNGFNILVGGAAKLAFGQQPGNTTAGASISPAVTVLVQDAYGNTLAGDTSHVTLAITTNPGGGTLSGTKTVVAVNGVATFSTLSINKAGNGYVLTATDGALTSAASSGFNIMTGPPTQLAFGVQPGNTAAGASITPAVTVLIQDALGNTVTNNSSSVTISLGTNPSGGTLSGNHIAVAANGVATFNNLSLNKVGNGYTLTAVDGSLTAATSNSFNITPGAATQLVFLQQPGNTTAGASISPAVTALVQDANGNTVTTDSSSVTLSLGTNPGGGTLSGTTTVAAVNGVATFSNLSINKAGSGYTLTANDGALTGAASSGFNITVGAAVKLAFSQQPGNTAAGASISPALTVVVQDANGNTVSGDTSNVSLAITTNPGGGTLSGVTAVAAANGVATFGGLSIDKAGNGYVLTATDGTLTSAAGNSFNITVNTAAKLAFAQQPVNTAAGASITPAVTVLVQDSYGNTVTANSSTVTIVLSSNPGNGTLSGATTAAVINGVATFSNLSINKTGVGYVLTATDGALTYAASSAFNVTAGAAAKLTIVQQPSNATAGASINPAVTVAVQDTCGNTVTTDSSTVTVSLGTNPGNGTLSGSTTVAAASGVATFSSLSINKAGTGYTLVAGDGALTGATSNGFNITAGMEAQLAFGQQPTSAIAGASISPAVTVLVQDAYGNTVTNDSSTVTLVLGANPGNGTLGGNRIVVAANGVATFSNLAINKVGTGYTLTASDGALTGATSGGFNITVNAAAKLAFSQQPANATAGTSIGSALTVLVQDANGNTVTNDNSTVTLSLGTNPGGGMLSGTTAVAAINGIATFSNLSINKAGNGYALAAADGLLAGGTSSSFNITAGAAAQLAFWQQPTSATAGDTINPAVAV